MTVFRAPGPHSPSGSVGPSVHRRPALGLNFRKRRGLTIIEMMVAMAITLMLVGTLATAFGSMSKHVSQARATVELQSQSRAAAQRLQSDLNGLTVRVLKPPLRDAESQGYFETIEGPVGPIIAPLATAYEEVDSVPGMTGADVLDSTVGDLDDVLIFTSRSQGAPFTGRYTPDTDLNPATPGVVTLLQSEVAEVAYFVRGNTLYRRALLVIPTAALTNPPPGSYYGAASCPGTTGGFYADNDISARQEGGPFDLTAPLNPNDTRLVANSLSDLTRRENRFGHQPWAFPHDARVWGELGLPTLRETVDPLWPFPSHVGNVAPSGSSTATPLGTWVFPVDVPITPSTQGAGGPRAPRDFWGNPHTWTVDGTTATALVTDPLTGTLRGYMNSSRLAEDAILNGVLDFDVELWDPGAPIFADPPYNGVANPRTGAAIVPGDGLYLEVLQRFIAAPNTPENRPVSFGAYVDMNYMCLTGFEPTVATAVPPVRSYEDAMRAMETTLGVSVGTFPRPHFAGAGDPNSQVRGQAPTTAPPSFPAACVYDTWSFHYERDGINQDGDIVRDAAGTPVLDASGNQIPLVDEGTDGQDNYDRVISLPGANGIVDGPDDLGEMEAPPPYNHALQGVRIRIRAVEPASKEIVELTVVQSFHAD